MIHLPQVMTFLPQCKISLSQTMNDLDMWYNDHFTMTDPHQMRFIVNPTMRKRKLEKIWNNIYNNKILCKQFEKIPPGFHFTTQQKIGYYKWTREIFIVYQDYRKRIYCKYMQCV